MDIKPSEASTIEFSKGASKDVLRLSSLDAISETTIYQALKSIRHKIRIICFCPERSQTDHMLAFSRLVDLIRADTMLDSACLQKNYDDRYIAFRNGTVVYFYREPGDEI